MIWGSLENSNLSLAEVKILYSGSNKNLIQTQMLLLLELLLELLLLLLLLLLYVFYYVLIRGREAPPL